MREINLYLRNSIYGTVTVDSSNKNLDTRVPVIVRSQPAVFFVRIFNNVNSVAAMTAAELNSLASTWVLNISPVANHTVPVCLQNDGFEVMSNGKLRLTISQTDTVESAKAINKLTRAVWSAELSGLPAGSLNPSVILRFKMCYENRIMDEDATPTENVTLFYTKVQIDSMLADVGAAIPHATETQYGTVELASEAEVTAGVDTERVVVPSTLKVELDKKESLVNKATDFSVSNDTKYPTVKAVIEYLALAIAGHGLVAVDDVDELGAEDEVGKIGLVVTNNLFAFYQKQESGWVKIEDSSLEGLDIALQAILGSEVESNPIWKSGENAPLPQYRFSEDGINNWHNVYDISTDSYMCWSVDGGLTWGDVIRFFNNDYNSLINKPEIPEDISDLNDSIGLLSNNVKHVASLPTATELLVGYVYILTSDSDNKPAGSHWKCVASGETYIWQSVQTYLQTLSGDSVTAYPGQSYTWTVASASVTLNASGFTAGAGCFIDITLPTGSLVEGGTGVTIVDALEENKINHMALQELNGEILLMHWLESEDIPA